MDDEEIIREVACEILGTWDTRRHHATTANRRSGCINSPLEKEPFAAVLMDLTIPGDGGQGDHDTSEGNRPGGEGNRFQRVLERPDTGPLPGYGFPGRAEAL